MYIYERKRDLSQRHISRNIRALDDMTFQDGRLDYLQIEIKIYGCGWYIYKESGPMF